MIKILTNDLINVRALAPDVLNVSSTWSGQTYSTQQTDQLRAKFVFCDCWGSCWGLDWVLVSCLDANWSFCNWHLQWDDIRGSETFLNTGVDQRVSWRILDVIGLLFLSHSFSPCLHLLVWVRRLLTWSQTTKKEQKWRVLLSVDVSKVFQILEMLWKHKFVFI